MNKQTGKRNSVRIIGGELRSRRITFSDGEGLRPTADRIRETLFNWLQEQVGGARCLDLFAGSGALGFEAMSRGASALDVVEAEAGAVQALRDNIHQLGLAHAAVHATKAQTWIENNAGQSTPYDIVFLDPPYAMAILYPVCAMLQASHLLADGCRIYIENSDQLIPQSLPANWELMKQKKSGQVYYYLFKVRAEDNSQL